MRVSETWQEGPKEHSHLATLTLGVISDIHHWYNTDGQLCSFGPYVREIDTWASFFGRTYVAAGVGRGVMPSHSLPYRVQPRKYIPLFHVPGDSLSNRLQRIAHVPSNAVSIASLMMKSDVVHLRTPSFTCLVAMGALLISKKPRIAKWAGHFGPYEGEPLSSVVQRILLAKGFLRGPVMVYGDQTKQHLVSFFPAAITQSELARLKSFSTSKSYLPPWHILMVGRTVKAKGFDLGLRALAQLKRTHPDLEWRAMLVGDGSCLGELQMQSRELGIDSQMEFAGGRTFAQVMDFYSAAHVLLMPGSKEGFSKVLIESCASGTIPVASGVGLTPWILGHGSRGILCQPTDLDLSDGLAAALRASEDQRMCMIAAGQEWAESLTLENFRRRLAELLITIV